MFTLEIRKSITAKKDVSLALSLEGKRARMIVLAPWARVHTAVGSDQPSHHLNDLCRDLCALVVNAAVGLVSEGEFLDITEIRRQQGEDFECITNNGVAPPARHKVKVTVNCESLPARRRTARTQASLTRTLTTLAHTENTHTHTSWTHAH